MVRTTNTKSHLKQKIQMNYEEPVFRFTWMRFQGVSLWYSFATRWNICVKIMPRTVTMHMNCFFQGSPATFALNNIIIAHLPRQFDSFESFVFQNCGNELATSLPDNIGRRYKLRWMGKRNGTIKNSANSCCWLLWRMCWAQKVSLFYSGFR